MKILLIGNGFDLEHKLPTSYKDFLRFCKTIECIYDYNGVESEEHFQRHYLNTWKINDSVKDALLELFNNRNISGTFREENEKVIKITTQNVLVDETYECIRNNSWLKYFHKRASKLGENWIDFETEISKVIQALDAGRFQLSCGGQMSNVEQHEQEIQMELLKCVRGSLKAYYNSTEGIDDLVRLLNDELNRLIRALEIYITAFVSTIDVLARNPDITALNPDCILSFNYSDTYQRVYGTNKDIEYDYIHGKAESKHSIESCNMVLGIDEYLEDDRKDSDLEFLIFKKFYQRIYKSTGNKYLDWVDEIKDGYAEYISNQNDAYRELVETIRNNNSNSLLFPHFSKKMEYPEHELYIFGHSLDVTDRDVLKLLICNDNVKTKIYYYREYENDKSNLGKIIKNLILIMGQDELIRRTGGVHKTIEFIPQTISREK